MEALEDVAPKNAVAYVGLAPHGLVLAFVVHVRNVEVAEVLPVVVRRLHLHLLELRSVSVLSLSRKDCVAVLLHESLAPEIGAGHSDRQL